MTLAVAHQQPVHAGIEAALIDRDAGVVDHELLRGVEVADVDLKSDELVGDVATEIIGGHLPGQHGHLAAYIGGCCQVGDGSGHGVDHLFLSLGSIQNSWQEASEAVAEPYAELGRQLPREPVLNSDETGYRTSGEKRWLWALVAPWFVFYKIDASRGAEVLVQLLGPIFAGILCSDRYSGYLKYHKGEGQFCWAHFKRNILGVQEIAKTTDAERFCRDALALHARLFRLWHRFRGAPDVRYGPVTRQELITKSVPLEKQFFALANRYLDSDDKDVRNLATALLMNFERFFTFLEKEGVEPTNNSAERALRCAVQWRKTSFGSRSAEGELAVARLLTVTRTCRMQHREPLRYLATAITSYRTAQSAPSLLKTASPT